MAVYKEGRALYVMDKHRAIDTLAECGGASYSSSRSAEEDNLLRWNGPYLVINAKSLKL